MRERKERVTMRGSGTKDKKIDTIEAPQVHKSTSSLTDSRAWASGCRPVTWVQNEMGMLRGLWTMHALARALSTPTTCEHVQSSTQTSQSHRPGAVLTVLAAGGGSQVTSMSRKVDNKVSPDQASQARRARDPTAQPKASPSQRLSSTQIACALKRHQLGCAATLVHTRPHSGSAGVTKLRGPSAREIAL
jgi:hypothetical protein